MATKLDDMKVQLAALSAERDGLDTEIEEMIASMAEVPAEQRKVGDWSPNGPMTKKYLDLTNRQAEVIVAFLRTLTGEFRDRPVGESRVGGSQ